MGYRVIAAGCITATLLAGTVASGLAQSQLPRPGQLPPAGGQQQQQPQRPQAGPPPQQQGQQRPPQGQPQQQQMAAPKPYKPVAIAAPPKLNDLESRTSTLAKPAQVTDVTGARLRDVRNVFTASRLRSRHPLHGMTPGGRSFPVYVSPFRSSEVSGLNGRLDRKSPMADAWICQGSCMMPLTTSRCR